jgi:hypothetical protein
MKLYTKEQLRNSMNSMKTYIEKYDESVIDKIVDNHIRALGGLELPSDDEIKKEMGYDEFDPYDIAYYGGIDYMRDKIQGGNNGNNNSN